jgi:hypothetical protein
VQPPSPSAQLNLRYRKTGSDRKLQSRDREGAVRNKNTPAHIPARNGNRKPNVESNVEPDAESSSAGAISGCTLRFDRLRRVLLVTFGKVATRESSLDAYTAVARFLAEEGPCTIVADLSAIEGIEITADAVRSFAWTPTSTSAPKPCIIVAPRLVVYGLSRMFQLLRDSMSIDIQVVHRLEEAYTLLALRSPHFAAIDSAGGRAVAQGASIL